LNLIAEKKEVGTHRNVALRSNHETTTFRWRIVALNSQTLWNFLQLQQSVGFKYFKNTFILTLFLELIGGLRPLSYTISFPMSQLLQQMAP
jgi:hypothetical protein